MNCNSVKSLKLKLSLMKGGYRRGEDTLPFTYKWHLLDHLSVSRSRRKEDWGERVEDRHCFPNGKRLLCRFYTLAPKYALALGFQSIGLVLALAGEGFHHYQIHQDSRDHNRTVFLNPFPGDPSSSMRFNRGWHLINVALPPPTRLEYNSLIICLINN